MAKSKKKISLSSAFEELEKVAQKLESGEMDLEEATGLYKKGLKLAAFLKKRLVKIENEIKEIKEAERK
jgi:exodeoxyribonuclease VII small subunit